jgi:cysteine desulfurase/selenocysteine lyase
MSHDRPSGEVVLPSADPRPRFDVDAIRAEFPALHQEVNGKPLTYLDNAASSMKPRAVLDAMAAFYERDYSNVHRGVHTLSQRATTAYEAARQGLATFLSTTPDEVVFTRGTTEGLNLVANAWGRTFLRPGDEVVLSRMEHHSNIVPWQMACQATGATLVVLEIDDHGQIAAGEIESKITARTKVVSTGHVSNALGTVNDIPRLAAAAHAVGALMVVDGAQGVPHGPVDPRALGADFYAFSGHKMFGPTGIGVLWGRRERLAAMPPWQGGGDMIRSVSFEQTTYADGPARFEAGTPAIGEAIGLGAAARWLMSKDLAGIAAHEDALLAYGHARLAEVPGLRMIGTAPNKKAVLGFVVDGVHPHDLGTLLDMEGVAVRVGHHCAEPVMRRFGVPATTRASLALYSTPTEIDRLVAALHKALSILS